MRQQDAFVLTDCAGLVVWPVEGRLALEHDKGVVFVRVRMKPILAIGCIGLQHDPHLELVRGVAGIDPNVPP